MSDYWTDERGRLHVQIMVDGKRAHRTLKAGATASDAKRVRAELLVALGKATKQVNIPGDIPMTKAIELYNEYRDEQDYAALRMVPWAKKFKASQADDFARAVIKDMRKKIKGKDGEMKQAYADATINRSLATIKKGLTLAWERKLIRENHGARIKVLELHNDREIFLTVEQVRSVAQHCTMQVQAAIWGALLTGARRGELIKLKAQYIGPDSLTFVRETTKTKRTRVVPIVDALRPWLEYFPLPIGIYAIKSAWQRARIKAGLEHVNFHDLRHSCASILLECGVDLYTIGQILGHANPNTTKRYSHLQIEQKRAALSKLSHIVLK
jgi:integrase